MYFFTVISFNLLWSWICFLGPLHLHVPRGIKKPMPWKYFVWKNEFKNAQNWRFLTIYCVQENEALFQRFPVRMLSFKLESIIQEIRARFWFLIMFQMVSKSIVMNIKIQRKCRQTSSKFLYYKLQMGTFNMYGQQSRFFFHPDILGTVVILSNKVVKSSEVSCLRCMSIAVNIGFLSYR
jgi:hypothetical protein